MFGYICRDDGRQQPQFLQNIIMCFNCVFTPDQIPQLRENGNIFLQTRNEATPQNILRLKIFYVTTMYQYLVIVAQIWYPFPKTVFVEIKITRSLFHSGVDDARSQNSVSHRVQNQNADKFFFINLTAFKDYDLT